MWAERGESCVLLTGVLDGQVGHQELLLGGGVLTVVTLEGFVVGVGELVIEQHLLVITCVVAVLTPKPATP